MTFFHLPWRKNTCKRGKLLMLRPPSSAALRDLAAHFTLLLNWLYGADRFLTLALLATDLAVFRYAALPKISTYRRLLASAYGFPWLAADDLRIFFVIKLHFPNSFILPNSLESIGNTRVMFLPLIPIVISVFSPNLVGCCI